MSTADKLLNALALFSFEAPEWTVDDAADALDVSGSTAYRYFSSLTKAGLLDPTSGGRYVLGPAIIAYDRQLRHRDPLINVASPVLKRLVSRNGGDGIGLLCRRFRQQVMCVYQHHEHQPDQAVSYERGRPMGLYRGAASLVILAHLPGRTLRSLYAADQETIEAAGLGKSWDEFKNKLRKIKTDRVCVTHGQLDPGMIGISAPIFHDERQIAGSVSIVLGEEDTKEAQIAGAAALVQAAANEIDVGLSQYEHVPLPTG
ncbi:DNA-binding IclR family transcriptional regulator [Sphingobium sp. JAI105]|uniref:IclR family transcriptional regulator n=1 Tax=Sphingobium sp. JAI105 TaxID=2787715 RepID=UPI0018C904B4|nr:IclR family transcriptional regulator C-terminal domain-containing protein [Sphingobium sp. JAI105]MBG6118481.1 DNA-binding IclR family transcriptional regulator [Sphingobium sp. JAI105]